MCFIGCVGAVLSLIVMLFLNIIDINKPLAISLPLLLFGMSNGITVANAIIGAISNSGKNAGSATGLTGAMQMAAGGLTGSLIIRIGGDESFLISMLTVILLSFIAVYNSYLTFRYKND